VLSELCVCMCVWVCVSMCVCVCVYNGVCLCVCVISCAISCTYNFRNENPFLTYGEQVSVLVQDFILFTLVTSYQGTLVMRVALTCECM
jgi:hypothetical protein